MSDQIAECPRCGRDVEIDECGEGLCECGETVYTITPEEAHAEYDAATPEPISESEVERIVSKITGDSGGRA